MYCFSSYLYLDVSVEQEVADAYDVDRPGKN